MTGWEVKLLEDFREEARKRGSPAAWIGPAKGGAPDILTIIVEGSDKVRYWPASQLEK